MITSRLSSRLFARGVDVQAVFVPDHILAFLTCDQDVERPIAIHIDETDFVGGLILMNPMFGEVSPAVVFKPGEDSGILGTDRKIRTPVAVDIAGGQAMRSDVAGVDLMRPPVW